MRGPAERGFQEVVYGRCIDADGRIVANIFEVIKYKGGLQGVAIQNSDNQGK